MRAHKGQSTVEYILLVTAVVAVIILFTAGNGSLFQQRLNSVLDSTTQSMVNVASVLSGSNATTNSDSGNGGGTLRRGIPITTGTNPREG